MPAPTQTQELNPVMRMLLEGVDDTGNEKPRELLIRRDRALVIWDRMVAWNGTREQIIASDPYNLLRGRPYEPIFPTEPFLMPGSLTTVYTSTSARTRLWIDITNHTGNAAATVRVTVRITGGSAEFDWLPSGTPIRLGAPGRWGWMDLDSGGFIRCSSSPANSCTIHPVIDRYSPTGDTP